MKVDLLAAEIGSTTTMVSAFMEIESGSPRLLGQGVAPTSVEEGDVRIGLEGAVEDLRRKLFARGGVFEGASGGASKVSKAAPGAAAGKRAGKETAGKESPEPLEWGRFFATSSAAGGLRMTVHGLAYDMTVRAGREAALGAGANLHHVTAGLLRSSDIEKILEIKPNIILIAGGVDYGERDTALHNAEKITELLRREELAIPVIYGGNIQNRGEIEKIFGGLPGRLYTVENVYPRIDELNVAPARAVIQKVFEEHITGGPGMEHIRDMVDGPVMPTPGAVLLAAQLAQRELGDLAVLDVGGATTDVHSVTAGSEEVQRILTAPEPEAKRTVEGDLGTYVSRKHILGDKNIDLIAARLGSTKQELEEALEALPPIPRSREEVALAEELTRSAAQKALLRHAGSYRSLFGPEGKKHIAEGKDLTAVEYLIATGGALTRLPGRRRILEEIIESFPANTLTPGKNVRIAFDAEYIMAAAGVIGREYPEAAAALVKKSIEKSLKKGRCGEEPCPDRR